MAKINVLIYDGPGVANLQIPLIKAIKKCLGHCYDVIPVDHTTIYTQPWQETTRLFIVPGGRDLVFLDSIHRVEAGGDASATGLSKIRNWVKEGGSYLGICAGAYFATERIEFEMDRPDYKVAGERFLKFLPNATAKGSVSRNFTYGSEIGAQSMKLIKPKFASKNDENVVAREADDLGYAYVNGGPYFEFDDDSALTNSSASAIACYEDGRAAVVDCKVGKGRAILTGPHLEVTSDHIRHLISSLPPNSAEVSQLKSILPSLAESDEKRLELLTRILELLGLQVNRDISPDDPTVYPIWFTCLDSNDTLYIKDRLISNATSASTADKTFTISDFTGIFVISPSKLEDETEAFEVLGDGKLPIRFCDALKRFPEFSISKYQSYLQSFCTSKPCFGSILMYAQRIGSTHTTIEKNPTFASILPPGTVFLTSQQTQGRGRGKNSWISQKGCLQFSLRIHHKRASSLVFIQYLFGVAVIEGIKRIPGCESIPLRLKWPNDIYIDTAAADNNQRAMDSGLMKIGGILVTSEYVDGCFKLLIGCGINVLNRQPTVSIDMFAKKEIEMECVFASILNSFETIYKEFQGGEETDDVFGAFRERYYSFWLHTNQLVQVKHTDGALYNAVLRGLDKTGFLKAKTDHGDIILLQPDGNSFDMLKNLISVKL